jgi:hypothetical protein
MRVPRRGALRLAAVNGECLDDPLQPLDAPPAAPVSASSAMRSALVEMRSAADILSSLPASLDLGYSDDEEAVQFAAADKMVAAFRVFDALWALAGSQ